MATLRDIRRRIKSVKNTQQITKAMKMVAAAKLRRAQEDIIAARPYAKKMMEVLSSLAARTKSLSHPLLEKRDVRKAEAVVITSDRGMCGAFNSSIIRTAENFIKTNKDKLEITLNLVGRKGRDYFRRRGLNIRQERTLPAGRPDYRLAADIGQDIAENYIKGTYDEVCLIYSEFKSTLSQRPVVVRLLPIEPANTGDFPGEYLFEPSEEAIFSQLLPKHVEVQVFRALLESAASEHGARMTAMDSATKNAKEMISGLTLKYNRARQAAITKELMEIIGGAEALKG
ncbi:MAG: F0F1 ATP synthase subunit gamma [Deltaproteobacteria bacterium GWC2_42_11]|nr:MAG: F0F1 ATP synthase subunit gamma [Deltaproteobacteria bacterium GWC2_42_11]